MIPVCRRLGGGGYEVVAFLSERTLRAPLLAPARRVAWGGALAAALWPALNARGRARRRLALSVAFLLLTAAAVTRAAS